MIKIFTKEGCPYCVLAKNLISSLWFEYEEIDITNDNDKFRELASVSEMITVPQIFAWEISSENLLWGYDNINKLNEEGKLIDILSK